MHSIFTEHHCYVLQRNQISTGKQGERGGINVKGKLRRGRRGRTSWLQFRKATILVASHIDTKLYAANLASRINVEHSRFEFSSPLGVEVFAVPVFSMFCAQHSTLSFSCIFVSTLLRAIFLVIARSRLNRHRLVQCMETLEEDEGTRGSAILS